MEFRSRARTNTRVNIIVEDRINMYACLFVRLFVLKNKYNSINNNMYIFTVQRIETP